MKRVILFFAILISAVACSLDEVDFGDRMFYNDVFGKWKFRNASVSSTGYSFIEFTEGRYFFAMKTDGSIAYGKYEQTDDYQFSLDEFAVIDVTKKGESSFTFDITMNGATEPISAEAYIPSDVTDEAEGDLQYSDKIYAVWEMTAVEGEDCGCECDDDCQCKVFGHVCNMEGCNCLCNENRVKVKYMLLASSGAIITIDNRGETKYTPWYWKDNNSTSGEIYSGMTSEKIITIVDVSTRELQIKYNHPNGNTYDVWFECKTSGQLDI